MPRRTGSGNAPRHAPLLKRNGLQRSGCPCTDVPPATFTSKDGTSMWVTLIITAWPRISTEGNNRRLGRSRLVT